ncbi:hypothetical protein ASPVEDRAFT_36830 [Aspergillus versicolor CBS 583.65]|uniref:Uncharacterized protein n=1 Tax=Aspergillus versicolor CBS 583.65 TaxID=1036611 RepID=A0A1L9P7A8_ASPVE|nr:uncharacterized protein ASPVEDRAFT_36830 [Aspergillus versicolor CBS 583.65]OJI97419.1 hypothetical protein ASPVEDRAFT_36830 [Aspergillus versicolor CBS 583.65]
MLQAAPSPTPNPTHTYARRFGRNYRGLDHLTYASLCSRDLGKVRVDCRLRVSKSQWGCLGVPPAGISAAIIYMDISFDQPHNCRLASGTVLVTLDEASAPAATGMIHDESLQMTDYYGPKHLSGEARNVAVTQTVHLAPELNVLGTGGSGIGVEREKEARYDSRWSFTGGLMTGRKGSAAYQTLKWELCENDQGGRSSRSNVIHTAFTLQHSKKPFIMRIEIQGRLKRSRDRIRHLRFPSYHSSDQGRSETLVCPNVHIAIDRPLDTLAKGLSSAMEHENYARTPVEIPDALPVSFSTENGAAPTAPQLPPTIQTKAGSATDSITGDKPGRLRVTSDLPSGILLSPDDLASSATTNRSSSVSNISSAATLVDASQHGMRDICPDSYSAILGSAVESLDGVRQERSARKRSLSPQPPIEPPAPIKAADKKEPVLSADENPMSAVSKYPVLILLVNALASILDFVFMQKGPRLALEKDPTVGDRVNQNQGSIIPGSLFPGQWPQD